MLQKNYNNEPSEKAFNKNRIFIKTASLENCFEAQKYHRNSSRSKHRAETNGRIYLHLSLFKNSMDEFHEKHFRGEPL